MNFTETALKGAYIVKSEPIEDERGYFTRTFCKKEFLDHGLNTVWVQDNISFNKRKGTVRGMHFQVIPKAEIKTVRCIRGSIYDVIIDMRKDSSSYCKWFACELNEENLKMLYIPEGFAHGFQTLTDKTAVFYQMSEFYAPECSRGVRWDDPVFNIRWPDEIALISLKDKQFPFFKP